MNEATNRAKKEKLGVMHRDYRIWQQLNCDLVEEERDGEFTGQMFYQVRPTCTSQPPARPDIDTIQLSREELEQSLLRMQEIVWSHLKTAHYLAEEQARIDAQRQAPPTVTAERMYDWALAVGRHLGQQRRPAFAFGLDQHNELVFELLCYYFAGDKRFETVALAELGQQLSLDKGIGLIGDVGRGKTVMMEAFRRNPLRPYGLVSARHVQKVFHEDAIGDGKRSHVSEAQRLYLGQGGRFMCFDDMGREANGFSAKIQYMGNQVHPMQAIILERADRFRLGQLPGWATHFTSNNPVERYPGMPEAMPSLTDLYDRPAADRLYELCNILELGGESRRG